ncbi:MAG TPA: aminomethyl-transferring glycine dehydrogenase subunit GcvPA [Bacteroidaceae bacterium]|nr:aminomethyl-transferring glycine dehydrogenase subunit GcvPA [Bacteroidaceae bacterium]
MSNYFPHTESDIASMLERIKIDSLDALYSDLPESILLKDDYNIPHSLSEHEIREHMSDLGKKNKILTIFAGAGAYDHYTPSAIKYLIDRSEFKTAYTPYQPEISQGTLRYIFEFQSMICSLTGMECANASMYDEATAAAESMMMSCALSKKTNKILVSATIHPYTRKVIDTYAKTRNIYVETIAEKDGVTDRKDMEKKLNNCDVAGVILSTPNIYGIIEDFSGFADLIHAKKALLTICADPSTLAVLKTPAEWGADMACGECQSLGMPLSYGGPYAGYLACKKELIRKLPGRIVGATTDMEGKRAFVLTLQAREQHIRRGKATSNICSNQSLMALHATIYLSLMGNDGLQQVNELSHSGAKYLHNQLIDTGKFSPLFDQPFLKEFALKSTLDLDKVEKNMLENGIMCGIRLDKLKPEHKNSLLISVTEKRTKTQIDKFVELIKQS